MSDRNQSEPSAPAVSGVAALNAYLGFFQNDAEITCDLYRLAVVDAAKAELARLRARDATLAKLERLIENTRGLFEIGFLPGTDEFREGWDWIVDERRSWSLDAALDAALVARGEEKP